MKTTKIKIIRPKSNIIIGEVHTLTLKDVRLEGKAVCAKLWRTRIDRKRAGEIFTDGHVSAASQRFPFHVIISDKFTDCSDKNINTYMENCWFKDTGMAYTTDDFIILEKSEVMFDDWYSLDEDEEIIKDIIE